MIKNLGYYVIPGIFEENVSNWQDIDTQKIIEDFIELTGDLKLDVNLGYGEDWQEDEDLWDLQLDLENSEFRGYIGNFYITWRKDANWECSNIWFSGSNEVDDSDQVHWFWDNK